jgi:hypothetical protein
MDREARECFLTALLMAEPKEFTNEISQFEVRELKETGFSAAAGWYGFVDAAGVGIVRQAGIEIESGLAALERLGRPEADSRSLDHGGRRLIRVDGGYVVLNFMKYRDRDYTAADRMRRYRERHSVTRNDNDDTRNGGVTTRNVTHAEAEAEAEADKSKRGRAKRSSRVPDDFSPDLDLARSQCPGIDAAREAQKFRDWEFKTPRSDWPAAWRNWIERCREKGEYARATVNGLGPEFEGYKFT